MIPITNVKKRYYPGTDTEVTSPFFLTRCECGYEFFRTHRIQTVTCRKCHKTFNVESPAPAGLKLD